MGAMDAIAPVNFGKEAQIGPIDQNLGLTNYAGTHGLKSLTTAWLSLERMLRGHPSILGKKLSTPG